MAKKGERLLFYKGALSPFTILVVLFLWSTQVLKKLFK